jgi:hypothetical protein
VGGRELARRSVVRGAHGGKGRPLASAPRDLCDVVDCPHFVVGVHHRDEDRLRADVRAGGSVLATPAPRGCSSPAIMQCDV